MLEVLLILTAVSLGIFAGAQLVEACILVPFWRRLSADEFFGLHHAMGPNLFRFFAPVTAIAALLALSSAVMSNGKLWPISAGVLSLIAVAMFFAYFKRANASFAARSIPDKQLPVELTRWTRWHQVRTAIVTGAFFSSVFAL